MPGLSTGDALERFEREICRKFDTAAAVCAPMARTAAYLAVRELIKPGQTVIMSPLTIIDVVNMVLLAGGVPVFADIVRDTCGIDPREAERLIDRRTGAVLMTHLHGESAGAFELRDVCRRFGIPLIEDCSQAFGAAEAGRRLGTIGEVGVYSFGFFKSLSAWQGGMLVSPDAQLIGRIRARMESWPDMPAARLLALALRGLLTDLATWPPFFSGAVHPALRRCLERNVQIVARQLDPEYGAGRLRAMPKRYRDRMTPAQAELALIQLPRIDAEIETRRHTADLYRRNLSGLSGLIVPRAHDGTSHIYMYYPIQYADRAGLLRYALERRRDFAAQHLRNCADLSEFREFSRDCPNARAAAKELILLPTYPGYPAYEAERNIEVLRTYLSRCLT
jgi:dTDP-4-amino-4,6-dideoxygalactose transaminase